MKKIVAIDGPSASGKSSVSKGVADRLGFVYVDSGSFYRGATWLVLREGIQLDDNDAVAECVKSAGWEFFVDGNAAVFSINGERPVRELRGKAVRETVAAVAAIPEVREFVVESLRALGSFGSLVMEGRDIGTVVFPETPYKFYLDADPHERAMRRYRELVAAGESEKAHEVMESLKRRDKIDSSRKAAPLKAAPDAHIIDSTNMTLEEVIELVVSEVEGK